MLPISYFGNKKFIIMHGACTLKCYTNIGFMVIIVVMVNVVHGILKYYNCNLFNILDLKY